ncbi:GTP-binding protein [Xylographa parallela]|nr:GTP-binding protein [Xylographa parallela]
MVAPTSRRAQLVVSATQLRLLTHLVRFQSSSATVIGESISVQIPPIPFVPQPARDDRKSSPIKPVAKAKSVPSTVLSYYYDTARPDAAQLRKADNFFRVHPPSILFSAGKFRTVKFTDVPEVAFLGRSNVGKSTLLNALMGQGICHTSRHPGRTKTMNGFAVGGPDGMGHPGRLTLLDMPGYGHGSREEWGPEIVKYLVGRKELRRAFLLVDSLHGLKKSDETILALFRHNAIPHQVVLSKVDRILLPNSKSKSISEEKLAEHAMELQRIVEKIRKQIQPKNDGPPALGEILTCSADNQRWKALSSEPKGRLGISALRWAVLAATGLDQKTSDVEVQQSLPVLNEEHVRD